MKTRRKIILDEFLGRIAVFFLNIIARILGKILSIDHSLNHIPQRIVVCKFLGMGSIIQSTPLLQTLRRSFPSAEIIFITSRQNETLLNMITVVDKTFIIEDKSFSSVVTSMFSVLRKLWKHKADLYIDLETYSYFSTALATMSCAKNRFGFYRIERNIRLGVYTHMMFFNARAAIAQSYLQMGRLAGCRNIVNELFNLKVNDAAKNSSTQKINLLINGTFTDYILINPNASDLRVERRWPSDNFISLIINLRNKYPEKLFFLIGSASEKQWVGTIYSGLDSVTKQKVFNTAGLFSLEELFEVIRNCSMMITNDTGPMHISFAMSRPTLALFGPASPTQYGNNPNAFGIYKNIYCSPCVHDFIKPPCCGDNQCMKQISVNEVISLCERIISESVSTTELSIPPMRFLKNDGHTSLGILERGF